MALPRVETATIALIRKGENLTKYCVAEKVFCDVKTGQRILKKIYANYDEVVIVGWVSIYRQKIPQFGIGVQDTRRPPRYNGAAYMRKKRKKDVEFYIDELNKKRAARQFKKLTP